MASNRGETAYGTRPPDGQWLTEHDIYLFNEGTNTHLYRRLGAHGRVVEGERGLQFAVWAPDAEQVSVVGDFNGWQPGSHPMQPHGNSGIWATFVPGVGPGTLYKYHIRSRFHGYQVAKADPLAFAAEQPPATASVAADLSYEWSDAEWMSRRATIDPLKEPISIYEVHLGSWMRMPEEDNRWLTYREIATRLADYVTDMGFTHVELLPVMEHPFYGSWGYQATSYFAPTARYGSPQDLMYLVDTLHQRGIGVILDWVPAHFPRDEHALGYFDGTALYEHADPRRGLHMDWDSLIFNYGRNEVRSFLLSSAMFWLEMYHADGLRVDAVASMLYRDYSRKEGEWVPNEFGGREDLEAVSFFRKLNEATHLEYPGVLMVAEESTSWPMVTRPTYLGGLGFGFKWDMGWMHDTLTYISRDPIHRRHHHHELTFRGLYAFTENFILPLSHDEVVHGKGSLLGKMPGDDWQKAANLRLLFAYMWAQPGKKLLFMGGEIGSWNEWNHEASVDWHLLDFPYHAGIQRLVREANGHYVSEKALHELDADSSGFEWIDANDADNSVLSFLRRTADSSEWIAAVFNFTPVPRYNYRVGVPFEATWDELFNSDAREYGGSGHGNFGGVETVPVPYHGRPCSVVITVPPLGAVWLKGTRGAVRE